MPLPSPPPPALLDFSGLISGAVGGLISGVFVEWWKSGREDLAKLCDEFCAEITMASESAAEYWLLPGNDPDCPNFEARLYGFQRRISGYNSIICNRVHDQAAQDIEVALGRLFDSLTGGEFGEPVRQPNMQAARKSQDDAADAVLSVRRGGFETASFRESAWRLLKRISPFKPAS